MKAVVIVAAALTVAILLAVSLLVARGAHGKDARGPLAAEPARPIRLSSPPDGNRAWLTAIRGAPAAIMRAD